MVTLRDTKTTSNKSHNETLVEMRVSMKDLCRPNQTLQSNILTLKERCRDANLPDDGDLLDP